MFQIIAIFVLSIIINTAIAVDYTYGYWLNGWLKQEDNQSKDILVIETSSYGFTLDMDNLAKPTMGLIESAANYEQSLLTKVNKVKNLPQADLLIEMEVAGVKYRATTSQAGKRTDQHRLASAQLWESARLVQNYELLGLEFKSDTGEVLECNASLHIVAWHDSLTLSLEVIPTTIDHDKWHLATSKIELVSAIDSWSATFNHSGVWEASKDNLLVLNCKMSNPQLSSKASITVTNAQGQNFPVKFYPKKDCLKTHIEYVERDWKTGYTDIRNYDEFDIEIQGGVLGETVPFLLRLDHVANITGLSPFLCDAQGRPTGIPVQLSKNWHEPKMGNYLMAYMNLPITSSAQNYKLRIPYGFYGDLPSASHANLSLIGYTQNNGNGRWEQLAIGCFGETICFDIDTSCVDNIITDIRGLMLRDGKEGRKWGWTDAGWGGDWLNLKDSQQEKYYLTELKTAYLSHGPCLTNVKYHGYYGANREVDFQAQVQTLRTDDYNRVFQKFSYTFTQDVKPESISLFKLGKTFHYQSPAIVYGNRQGLLKEHVAPSSLKHQEMFLQDIAIEGSAPWWVAFPQGEITKGIKANGYRSLIIRDYKVVANGKTYTQPRFSSSNYTPHKNNKPNLELQLLAPKEVSVFKAGDTIELDLELITLPRQADDYYGPNESFRQHLIKNPQSWKTTHREAVINNLQVKVDGGVVENNYPLLIQAQSPEVTVHIARGLGAVPISFKGLDSATGYKLYQKIEGKWVHFNPEVHGNDYWQTDYDEATQRYQITYNLPLDGVENSVWLLTKSANK